MYVHMQYLWICKDLFNKKMKIYTQLKPFSFHKYQVYTLKKVQKLLQGQVTFEKVHLCILVLYLNGSY